MLRQTLLLLLAVLALCLAACKREPDLPADPHVPLVNPFTGVWKETETQYWQFKPDGTGGRAATQAGPFPDEFSFLFFNGKGTQAAPPSLVMLEGSPVTVTCYEFSIAGNRATLSPVGGGGGVSVTLEQISGDPQVLNLTNPFIGEWTANWTSIHGLTWSLKYYADGTIKTYHHEVRHQFENAYALRGNTLVIYGAWRFGIAPVIAEISQQGNGTWRVTETQSDPEPAEWIYTKVAAAEWL
jgi:hypothetical protein